MAIIWTQTAFDDLDRLYQFLALAACQCQRRRENGSSAERCTQKDFTHASHWLAAAAIRAAQCPALPRWRSRNALRAHWPRHSYSDDLAPTREPLANVKGIRHDVFRWIQFDPGPCVQLQQHGR